jgi:hypothetical protein
MAVSNFIPTIWSARILSNLQKTQVFAGLCNRDYQGEITNFGDTVKIGGIGAISVSPYTKNSTSLSWATLTDATQSLVIDQSQYFAFKVDDVDAVQVNVNLIDEAMKEAAYAISDLIDAKVASLYADAATANKLGADGASAKTIGYGSSELDPYKTLVNMGVLLSNANIPQSGRWAVVPPWFAGMLRKSSTFVANPAGVTGQSMVNGFVSRIAGFDIYESNNVTNDAQSTKTWRIMLGTRDAISLAVQKQPTMEAIRLQDSFSDGVRGLLLYGVKVVRPAALSVLFAKEGADA